MKVHKTNNKCCCPYAKSLSVEERNSKLPRESADLDKFLRETYKHLRALSQLGSDTDNARAREEFADAYDPDALDIPRSYFSRPENIEKIPFRWSGCPQGFLTCCGECPHTCRFRCPQDVVTRAYLFCATIINAMQRSPEEGYREYIKAPLAIRLLYDEFTNENGRYFRVAAQIQELISSRMNSKLKELVNIYGAASHPHKLKYSPRICTETHTFKRKDGTMVEVTKPVTNPTTGAYKFVDWPNSGLCPFCLPHTAGTKRVSRKAISK